MKRMFLMVAIVAMMVGSASAAPEVKKAISANSDIADIVASDMVASSKEVTVKAGELITVTATAGETLTNPTAIMFDGEHLKFVKAEKGKALGKNVGISVISAKSPDRLMIRVASISKEKPAANSGELYCVTLKALKAGKTRIDFVDMIAYTSKLMGNSVASAKPSFEVRPATLTTLSQ